jgi:hypothetical protein
MYGGFMPNIWEWLCVLGNIIKKIVFSEEPGRIKKSAVKKTTVNGFGNTVTSEDTIINVNGPVTIQNDFIIERERKQNCEALLKTLQGAQSECKLYYRGEDQPGCSKSVREGLLGYFRRFLRPRIYVDWTAAEEPKTAMQQNYAKLLEAVNKGDKEEEVQQELSGNDLQAKRIARNNVLVKVVIDLLKQMEKLAANQEDLS